jgi:hypothetical protein
MHTKFWTENLKEADHLGDLSVDGDMLVRLILKKSFGRVCTGSICLRIQNHDEHV